MPRPLSDDEARAAVLFATYAQGRDDEYQQTPLRRASRTPLDSTEVLKRWHGLSAADRATWIGRVQDADALGAVLAQERPR